MVAVRGEGARRSRNEGPGRGATFKASPTASFTAPFIPPPAAATEEAPVEASSFGETRVAKSSSGST